MRVTVLAAVCAASWLFSMPAAAGHSKSKAEPHAPTYEEIRAQQTLGRVIAAPDGNFFLYEWIRPYNWVRDTGKLPPAAANRMQAWLYKVDVDITPTTSQYLFHPGSGCSYWLGDLSPDTHRVAFYELDNDYNTVKAGVWDMVEGKLTWFDAPPDAARLDQRAVWVSNDEVSYPAKLSGAQFARANAATGVAKPCADCGGFMPAAFHASSPSLAVAHNTAGTQPGVGESGTAESLVPNANVLAKSAQGDLAIFAKDTSDELTLIFQKGSNEPETVFENKRR